MIPYTPPVKDMSSFNCPHCNAYAKQLWGDVSRGAYTMPNFRAALCQHCSLNTVWYGERMIHPASSSAPLANPDLPQGIQIDYNEARAVVGISPRAAAALLRLCIQKLCIHLGEKGENINHDIGELVKKGLPPTIQKAMDVVRITGNNAVHPGELDLTDSREIALKLFSFVNHIAEKMISEPKEIELVYGVMPEGAKSGIEKRDSKSA